MPPLQFSNQQVYCSSIDYSVTVTNCSNGCTTETGYSKCECDCNTLHDKSSSCATDGTCSCMGQWVGPHCWTYQLVSTCSSHLNSPASMTDAIFSQQTFAHGEVCHVFLKRLTDASRGRRWHLLQWQFISDVQRKLSVQQKRLCLVSSDTSA